MKMILQAKLIFHMFARFDTKAKDNSEMAH